MNNSGKEKSQKMTIMKMDILKKKYFDKETVNTLGPGRSTRSTNRTRVRVRVNKSDLSLVNSSDTDLDDQHGQQNRPGRSTRSTNRTWVRSTNRTWVRSARSTERTLMVNTIDKTDLDGQHGQQIGPVSSQQVGPGGQHGPNPYLVVGA